MILCLSEWFQIIVPDLHHVHLAEADVCLASLRGIMSVFPRYQLLSRAKAPATLGEPFIPH